MHNFSFSFVDTTTSQMVYSHDLLAFREGSILALPSPAYLWTKDIQQKNETVNLWVYGSLPHTHTHTKHGQGMTSSIFLDILMP